jgi:hypothetical protein
MPEWEKLKKIKGAKGSGYTAACSSRFRQAQQPNSQATVQR